MTPRARSIAALILVALGAAACASSHQESWLGSKVDVCVDSAAEAKAAAAAH